MLLDSEPRSKRETANVAIPPKDNAPALPPPAAPKAEPAKDVAAAKDVGPAKDAPPAKDVAPAAPAAPPPAAAKVEPVPTPAAKVQDAPKAASTGPREGFVVQVGAFKDETKLQQARAKLQQAGVAHYTERMESKAGPLTRLRAGPFATRVQAEAAQVAIRRAALEGKVMPLP
jgi:DedD protein